jgi:hypothetical protein
MTQSLTVSVGANVTDLHTKMALAQADVRNLTSEVKSLTTQMTGASDEIQAELLPQLEHATTELAAAKGEVASLRGELNELKPAAEHAGGAFVSLRESTEGINARLTETKELASGLGELFLVGLGGEKLIELAEHAAEFGDKMKQAHEETGLTTDALQALSYAASHADVDFDGLQRGVATFASKTQQAIAGAKGQQAAFQILGISLQELREHGDDAEYMLVRVANAIDQYADGANKETIVTALFGQKLKDMGPVLHDLAQEGIQGLINKNTELGGQFSGQFIEDTAKAETAIKDFHHELDSLGIEVGAHILPILTSIEHGLNAIFSAKGDLAASVVPQLETQLGRAEERLKQLTTEGKAWYEGRWFESDAKAIQDQITLIDELKAKLVQARAEQTINGPPMTVQGAEIPDSAKLQAPNLGDVEKSLAEADKLKHQAYERAISLYQADAAAYGSASNERIAILGKELTLAESTWGKGSTEYNNIQKEINAATRQQATQRSQIEAQATQEFIKGKDQELSAFIEHEQALVGQNKLTINQAELDETALTGRIFDEERKRLDLAIQMAGDDIALYTKLSNQKIALKQRETDQLQKISDKGATERETKERQTDQAIARSGASTITSLITGKETWLQAADSIVEKGLERVIEYGLEEVAHAIGIEGLKSAALAVGETTRLAAKETGAAAGKAIDATAGSTSVLGDANKAAAGAYAAVADIPYVGPVLAPIAAAAAFTGVMAFDIFSAEGGFDIPSGVNPMVMAHAEEMILPRDLANPIRAMARQPTPANFARYEPDLNPNTAAGGAGGGGAAGGGDTHVFSPTVNITANGRLSASDLHDLDNAVVGILQKAHRNFTPLRKR